MSASNKPERKPSISPAVQNASPRASDASKLSAPSVDEVHEVGRRLLARRLVQSVASKAQAIDASELLTMYAIRLAKSPKELGAVRLAAIKYVHEIAGILAPDLRSTKPVAEMSPAELDHLITSMRTELQARAEVNKPAQADANAPPALAGESDSESDRRPADGGGRWRPVAVAAQRDSESMSPDPPPTPTRDGARFSSQDLSEKIPPIE